MGSKPSNPECKVSLLSAFTRPEALVFWENLGKTGRKADFLPHLQQVLPKIKHFKGVPKTNHPLKWTTKADPGNFHTHLPKKLSDPTDTSQRPFFFTSAPPQIPRPRTSRSPRAGAARGPRRRSRPCASPRASRHRRPGTPCAGPPHGGFWILSWLLLTPLQKFLTFGGCSGKPNLISQKVEV